jgi:hypothetical protein
MMNSGGGVDGGDSGSLVATDSERQDHFLLPLWMGSFVRHLVRPRSQKRENHDDCY